MGWSSKRHDRTAVPAISRRLLSVLFPGIVLLSHPFLVSARHSHPSLASIEPCTTLALTSKDARRYMYPHLDPRPTCSVTCVPARECALVRARRRVSSTERS